MTGPAPITTINGLGPATEAEMHRAGIMDADALRALGADAAYRKLLAAGSKPHFIAYYALHMALQGRPWNDCKGAEKDAFRIRFDAILSERGGSSALDRFMDEVGLLPRKAKGT